MDEALLDCPLARPRRDRRARSAPGRRFPDRADAPPWSPRAPVQVERPREPLLVRRRHHRTGQLLRHRDELGQLTAGIRRLVEVMKQEDLLADDIKEEYRRLVREKERLQTRCEKLELDLERRQKRVLDADLIRRALQDFERLVGLLPLEDQKDLFQLLRQVEVAPFEPGREVPREVPPTASRNGRAGATAGAADERALAATSAPGGTACGSPSTSSRTCRTPRVLTTRGKFGIWGTWSPRRGKSRTFLSLTIVAGATLVARGVARLAYHFEGTQPPDFFKPSTGRVRSSKQHRNPVALVQEWQRALDDGECTSWAALARKLGVTRTRVTQVLGLLDLAPGVVHAIAAFGDPLPRPIVSEPMLRPLLTLPAGEQKRALEGVCPTTNLAGA